MARNIYNKNLITSLGGYAQIYQFRTGKKDDIEIFLKFYLSKQNLENVIKILYDSEIDVGLWGNSYRITQYKFSGTIHNLFYFFTTDNVSDILDFLLDLYVALYSRTRSNDQKRRQATEALLHHLQIAYRSRPSGDDPIEILEAINAGRYYTSDYFTFNIVLDRVNYYPGVTPTSIIIDDRAGYQFERFNPAINMQDLINTRFAVHPEIAHQNDISFNEEDYAEMTNARLRQPQNNPYLHMITRNRRLLRKARPRPTPHTNRPGVRTLRQYPLYQARARHTPYLFGRGIRLLEDHYPELSLIREVIADHYNRLYAWTHQ